MSRQTTPSRSRFGSTLSPSPFRLSSINNNNSNNNNFNSTNNNLTNRLSSPESHRHTGERPVLPRCYLCGQQFGTRSIGIHIPQCYAKKMAQWAISDPHTRGQAPKHPDSVNWRGEGKSAMQQSEEQFQEFVRNLEPCPHCGRRFIADRLQVHLRSCRPGHTARPISPSSSQTSAANNNYANSRRDVSFQDDVSEASSNKKVNKPHTPPNRFATSSPPLSQAKRTNATINDGTNNNNNNTNKRNNIKATTLPAISTSKNAALSAHINSNNQYDKTIVNNDNDNNNDDGNDYNVTHDKRVCPLTNRLPSNAALNGQSRTCVSCKTVEYDIHARFCKECGHTLEKSKRHSYHCIHCGDQLPTRARFCPTCGEPVEDMTSSVAKVESATESNETKNAYNAKKNTKKEKETLPSSVQHANKANGVKSYSSFSEKEEEEELEEEEQKQWTEQQGKKHVIEENDDDNTSTMQSTLTVRMSACPSCKVLCDADGNFCDHCGAALGEVELVTRNTNDTNSNNNKNNNSNNTEDYCMYCAACKEQVDDMTCIYCEECGCKLEKRSKELPTVPQTLPPLEQTNAIKALKSALQNSAKEKVLENATNNNNHNISSSNNNNVSPTKLNAVNRTLRQRSVSQERSSTSHSLKVTPPQNRNQNNYNNEQESQEQEEEERRQCPNCNRCFAISSYQRHVRVCQSQKTRKVFNMRKHRLSGLEVSPQRLGVNTDNSNSNRSSSNSYGVSRYDDVKLTPRGSSKKNWREESRAFRQAMRDARKVDVMLKSGAPLRNLPPPTYSVNPDYIQCPHCTRRFAPEVAARHIPRCATTINKPKPPPQHPRRR